jgi:putative membrane protein
MDPTYWGPHFFGWMWIFPVIFLIVCLVFLFTFFSRGPGCWGGRHWHRHDGGESARDILDKRYAKGEIAKDQYEEMKRDLGEK